jgi:two-component system, OmpR family, KDP operon response regulator KdpE
MRYGRAVADLLLVEDDAEIRRALIRALIDLGHVVSSAATAMAGLQAILDGRPDCVILDLGLPDIDGEELIRMVRAVSSVPIVVATARGDEAAMVQILAQGADDYVVKPFGPAQLDARIKAVLRRSSGLSAGVAQAVQIGDLRVDPDRHEVTLSGLPVDLTPREFDLLSYLASRVGSVVSRRELLTQVWRQPYGGPDDTVDVHLSWLRRKLGESAQRPRYLHTIRGVGVRLAAPAESDPDEQP